MCRRILIGLGLVFFQQFTGQPNLMYYAADVFRIVGFCGESEEGGRRQEEARPRGEG